ncbi:hypothetical protein ABT150_26250 [Streptomyces mirabilis]|uniref:hypothetical protein n=1 Tax=Streptomyces mirabilis TaxID=68239 RepID=UPI00331A70A3
MECDALRRAAPGIYTAGDVAFWRNPHFGTHMRLEHRMNATGQAMAAVGKLLGDAKPFVPVPYFWTDRYDTRIQAYGVLGWSTPRQVRTLRRLVVERASWTAFTVVPALRPATVN